MTLIEASLLSQDTSNALGLISGRWLGGRYPARRGFQPAMPDAPIFH